MKISIIVPVYNTEKYLARCLDSLLNQTHKDLQIIVVDDGSKDKSGQIADEYAAKDNRIEVLHIENGGVSNARNQGINLATGDYIAFVDSDDFVRADMYERLIALAKETNADVLSSDLVIDGKIITHPLQERYLFLKEEIEEEILPLFSKNGAISVTEFKNKIFKNQVIKGNNICFYVGFSYQEDLMFMINVLANISSFYYLPEPFYEYYPLSTGLYSSYRKDGGVKFIEARQRIKGLIEKYKIKNLDEKHLNESFLYNITWFVYRTENRVKSKKEKRLLIYEVLKNEEVISVCEEIEKTASSFDKRIATAIVKRKLKLALFWIKFVYSGKAGKIQNLIAKLKGNK